MSLYPKSARGKTTAAHNDAGKSTTSTPRNTRHPTHTTSPERSESAVSTTAKEASSSTSQPSFSGQASSSTIDWGPAITASPLPSSGTTGLHPSSDQPSSDMSEGSKKAVIAVTTIGGTLLLALLIYALWRKRKGATHSEIIHFRPHSGTIILNSSREERLTALPIYQETRYSVRSSKIGSTLSFGKAMKRPSGVPASVAERFHKEQPWMRSEWKTANPPTPTMDSHPLAQVMASSSPELKPPEMARVYTRQSERSRMNQNSSGDTTKSGLAISIGEASPNEREFGPPPETPQSPKDVQDRWSWTNSQAPPTPRFHAAPSLHSSLSSLPRFKRVTSWVRGQAERQTHRIDEERPPPSRTISVPMLKNKASKPTLAPKPTRKLSKKKRPESSRSQSFQPSSETAGPVPPTSARLAEQWP